MKRLLTLGLVLFVPVAVARAGVEEAYDDAVKARGQVEITFGHDVDLKGKAWDFAKTLAGSYKLSSDDMNKLKGAVLNATDFYEDTASHGLSEADLARFVVKTMLDNLGKREQARLRLTFGKKVAGQLTEHGTGLLEGGAQAAGEAAEGEGRAAVETALLATIDTVCPNCAAARKGALLAVEAAREVEAWTLREATQLQYDAWKNQETLLTTHAFGPTLSAARKALEAIYTSQGRRRPATPEEVEQFVKHRFESWKRAEEAKRRDADVLTEAREDYLALSDFERGRFRGRTEEERAAAFADAFLPIYGQLMSFMGDRPYPVGGRKQLLKDAVRLAQIRASNGEGSYRDEMFDTLRRYGWVAVPPERKEAIKDRLVERLSHLSFTNLKTFFDYAELSQSRTDAFYGCLCSRSTAGASHVGKKYEPKYGLPCHLFGLGDWWEPFPSDAEAWSSCLTQTAVGGQSFADHLAERVIKWQAVK